MTARRVDDVVPPRLPVEGGVHEILERRPLEEMAQREALCRVRDDADRLPSGSRGLRTYPSVLGADGSVCQMPNSFPCGSLQMANQPIVGTGIGSPASPPSSRTRAVPALMSSTSK